MTDDLNAEGIARKQFSTAFRGFDQYEVRAYLGQIATTIAAWQEREKALRERLDAFEQKTASAGTSEGFDLEAALGAETTKVLHAAREAANEIRSHAEESVARMLREASDEATTMRAEAEAVLAKRTEEADAEASAIIAAAETRGREMVGEAQAVRERMLKDLSRKRKVAAVQLEQLLAARQRLLDAYDVVRQNLDSVTDELAMAEEQARLAADVAGLKPPPDEPLDLAPVDEPVVADDEPVAASDDAPATPPRIVIVDDELADQPQGSATAPDDRRSSSLRLLRPVAEPPMAPVGDDDQVEGVRLLRSEVSASPRAVTLVPDEPSSTDDAAPEAPAVEVAAEAEADGDGDGEDAAAPVDDLFTRLRAGRAAALEHAESVLSTGDPDAGDAAQAETPPSEPDAIVDAEDPVESDPEPVASVVDAAFESRDAALESYERALVKATKRALADEQNEVLDTLRRAKRTPALDDLMPAADDHAGRYTGLAVEQLQAAAAAGAASQGGSIELDGEQLGAFGRGLAEDVRGRIGRALDSTGSDDEALVEAISAAYREWKTSRTEPFVRHHLAAAYSFGAFQASGDVPLRWVVDPAEGACPDCDDNALAGPTPKGERYPTGQAHPPAHTGCRCLVVPAAN
jgi:DivIVA domain-containing protein